MQKAVSSFFWLASYPRSGNTLLRAVLFRSFGLCSASIYPNDMGRNPDKEKLVGHLEHDQFLTSDGAIEFSADLFPENIVCLKTHDSPANNNPAIYIVRDGRETCVSFWKYLTDGRIPGYEGAKLRDVIEGNTPFGSWSDHICSWAPWERPDTFPVSYEDLVDNPKETIEQLASILGLKARSLDIPTFAEMRATESHSLRPGFFRSGTNQTWKEIMSQEDLGYFYRRHGELLEFLGYTIQVNHGIQVD